MTIKATSITNKFVEALNEKFKGRVFNAIAGDIVFTCSGGRSYDRIMLPKWAGLPEDQPHAFVERSTGKLYRAATNTAPVTDARYDLSIPEEFIRAVELADPAGNYLKRKHSRGYVPR